MSFELFNSRLREHIQSMTLSQEYLFVVDLDKETVWNTYLDSFPKGTNEVFRERREFDCAACRHFIRDLGRVVAIKNQEIVTIWDFDAHSNKYQPVIDALSALIKSRPIADVFLPTERKIGLHSNRERLDSGGVFTWYHLSAMLPNSIRIWNKDNVNRLRGKMRDTRNVFRRSLEEITSEAVDTVLELIAQLSLYKGDEWYGVLKKFKSLQYEYLKIGDENLRDLYCWEKSVQVGEVVGRIRNHSMGVLLIDLSEGVMLDTAVKKYETLVAPTNYRRPKPIFTKKMIEKAYETVKELGYEESLGRRYATLEDITVTNTLFANRDAKKAMSGNVFEQLAESVPDKPKDLSKVEEIGIDTFEKDVLPKISDMEILLENKHSGNMVSLIAPLNADSKSMLKWSNNFSWAYSGNITDSMKERVKAAGGNVEGVLRFSIQWNENNDNHDDLDAHCKEPGGNHIHFNNRINRRTGGNLDIDIITPGNKVAVENITWPNKARMQKGKYYFVVHCYTSQMAKSGFSAEIEFDNQIYSFDYPKPLRRNEQVNVADVDFDGKTFKLEERLKSQQSSKELWGIQTNKFHPVSIMTLSPNFWDGQHGIGNKHFMFFIDGCKNPDTPSGFFPEFLDDRLREHRKVFEGLAGKFRVEPSDNQLSGLGFSSTLRNELVVKLKGAFSRMLKVKF